MPAIAPPPQYTHAQLHALVCVVCGLGHGELVTVAHVALENRPGQYLPWALVAHPDCRTAS